MIADESKTYILHVSKPVRLCELTFTTCAFKPFAPSYNDSNYF